MVAGARVLELTHTHSQPGFPGVEDEGKKREKKELGVTEHGWYESRVYPSSADTSYCY